MRRGVVKLVASNQGVAVPKSAADGWEADASGSDTQRSRSATALAESAHRGAANLVGLPHRPTDDRLGATRNPFPVLQGAHQNYMVELTIANQTDPHPAGQQTAHIAQQRQLQLGTAMPPAASDPRPGQGYHPLPIGDAHQH